MASQQAAQVASNASVGGGPQPGNAPGGPGHPFQPPK